MRYIWFFVIILSGLITPYCLPAQNLLEQAKVLRAYVEQRSPGQYYFTTSPDKAPRCAELLATILGSPDPEGQSSNDILDNLFGNPFIDLNEGKCKVCIPYEYENLIPSAQFRAVASKPSLKQFDLSELQPPIPDFSIPVKKQSKSFLADLKTALSKDEFLNALCPSTIFAVRTMDRLDLTDRMLRQSFSRDMYTLRSNFKNLLINNIWKRHGNVLGEFLVGNLIDASSFISYGIQADSIFAMLAASIDLQRSDLQMSAIGAINYVHLKDLAASFKVTQLLSESFYTSGPDAVWLDQSLSEQALNDQATFYLYLGLLWQHGDKISFSDVTPGHLESYLGNGKSFRDILSQLTNYSEFRKVLNYFNKQAEAVELAQSDYRQLAQRQVLRDGTVPFDVFDRYVKGITGMLETGAYMRNLFGISGTGEDTVFSQNLLHLLYFQYNCQQRAYRAAVNELVQVLNNLSVQSTEDLSKYLGFIADIAEIDNASRSEALPLSSAPQTQPAEPESVKKTPIKPSTQPARPDVVFGPRIWALIVGIERYESVPVLQFAKNDAYELSQFLLSTEGGGLRREQVKLISDNKASKTGILKAMQEQFGKADSTDMIVFYFSGHGSPGAFLPQDYTGAESTKLTHSEVAAALRHSPAKYKIIIADACFSGSFSGTKDSRSVEAILQSYYEGLQDSQGGTAILTSSKATEMSKEVDNKQQGVFSYYLVEGLRGAADIDGDSQITLNELFEYVRDNTMIDTGNAQTPVLQGNCDGNLPILVLRPK